MTRRERWRLDPDEVERRSSSARSGGRAKLRQSRALDVSGVQMRLRHGPTGLEVEGVIAPGHYSRAELRTRRDALEERLFGQLEAAVARHLRIPGR
jgi:hypothetical protein